MGILPDFIKRVYKELFYRDCHLFFVRSSHMLHLQRSSTAFGELIKDYAKRKKATPFVADVNEILPTNDMLNAHPLYSLLYKELPRIADNHNGPERSCVLVRTTYLSAKTSSAPQITFNNHSMCHLSLIILKTQQVKIYTEISR